MKIAPAFCAALLLASSATAQGGLSLFGHVTSGGQIPIPPVSPLPPLPPDEPVGAACTTAGLSVSLQAENCACASFAVFLTPCPPITEPIILLGFVAFANDQGSLFVPVTFDPTFSGYTADFQIVPLCASPVGMNCGLSPTCMSVVLP